jgi:hypothetical protein
MEGPHFARKMKLLFASEWALLILTVLDAHTFGFYDAKMGSCDFLEVAKL